MAESLRNPCYFTCVLSEALEYNLTLPTTKTRETTQGLIYEHQEFGTICAFVDFLATVHGDHLAVGCVAPKKGSPREGVSHVEELLTFADVVKQSNRVSHYFRARLGANKAGRCCVALLASSSVVFMLTWLGLMRLDYEVLLIAPQSSPEAIRHLIQTSKAFAICYDTEHEVNVLEAIPQANNLQCLKLPWPSFQSLQDFDITLPDHDEGIRGGIRAPDSTAFYFHSSGTTGLPKLIPQTHNGAVGILPKLQDLRSPNPRVGTFTTTPLYHGGIADLLRCWSSASPVWLFPEGKVAVIGPTVSTIIHRIDEISTNEQKFPASRLGYLSCVPYVLDALSKMPDLKRRLCDLDVVGVGGASMPQELGDELVASGVRLVSRFGSSECGFLLSSQRDYEADNEWNVHRCTNTKGLRFAPLPNGRYELAVTQNWPLVSTAVHARQPFNTHDVFAPHKSIPGAWHYVGRSDSQLTLSTGKKFDPTEMEDRLRQNDLVEDIIIIGDDKPFTCAIIFASRQTSNMQPEQRYEGIKLAVKKANVLVPSYARLEESCFIVLNFEQYGRVRKNNKGGVIRSAILSDFRKELSNIYGNTTEYEDNNDAQNTLEDISALVTTSVQAAVGSTRHIRSEDDLFDCGVDSVSSLQIRNRICAAVPMKLRSKIPLHIVYECGTISAITRYVSNLLTEGCTESSTEGLKRTIYQEMEDMLEKYVSGQAEMLNQTLEQIDLQPAENAGHGTSVILTGSTGFLGVHILKLLIKDEKVAKIFLFVRGSNQVLYDEQTERAKARVRSALDYHDILRDLPDHWEAQVEYIPFMLREPWLGIPRSLYARLASETTHLIHAAWEVNFNLPLKTFASQVEGTTRLFNLALLASRQNEHRPVSFLFCSSVASIANMTLTDSADSIPTLSKDPSHAANLGYGQSKWVAESLLARLNRQNPGELAMSILRIGQLSGDTLSGIWNTREAWPLMLETSLEAFGGSRNEATEIFKSPSQNRSIILPDLANTTLAPLDWLPVDCAAECIWRSMGDAQAATIHDLRVMNVVNTASDSGVTWRQAQEWTSAWAETQSLDATVMPPGEWLDRLENLPTDHRAKALVPLWRQSWVPTQRDSGPALNGKAGESDNPNPPHAYMEGTGDHQKAEAKAKEGVQVGINDYILDKEYFWRILNWLAREREITVSTLR